MTVYYNEFDPYAATMLRNLITAGHIADGVVDTRSIEDVRPSDLIGFTQCHFFAGVGVWSYALRAAGWPDDRPVWTGSCPCQPFSAAGKGLAFADERHLWPDFGHLIRERKPAIVLGEQVASKDVDAWIDLVHADLEAMGYAFGSVPFPSAGVGAPHIRDRNYWVANAWSGRRKAIEQHGALVRAGAGKGSARNPSAHAPGNCSIPGRLADADGGNAGTERQQRGGEQRQQPEDGRVMRMGDTDCKSAGRDGRGTRGAQAQIYGPNARDDNGPGYAGDDVRRVADSDIIACGQGSAIDGGRHSGGDARPRPGFGGDGMPHIERPGPTNGFWRDADWLGCTDGKWRPVESRPQPLVDGSAESLGRVRPDAIEEIEKEINATTAQSEGGRAAAMRDLLINLGAEAQRGWPSGRLPGLHEAPFLLSFLRQLQEQGWRIAEGVALPRPEAAQAYLRVLRDNATPPGAPREHGLAGQQSGERANAMHFLSSLLARHAHSAWDHAYSTYAEIGFPLAHGARSRVGRLRASGNAINAEAARIFIEAVMECQP